MFRLLGVLLVVGCGTKDDAYTPGTSLGMGEEGCWVTDAHEGQLVVEFDMVQDCTLCPLDWECSTYENMNNTKCFLPCRDQADCDECVPDTVCIATTIGLDAQEVLICKD
jgi:hypothetical protein